MYSSLTKARREVDRRTFQTIHKEAVAKVKDYKRCEAELIHIIQKVDAHLVYRYAGYNSLYNYLHQCLGLTESQAYSFGAVARKAKELPALQKAIDDGELSLSKATRLTSVINSRNQLRWVGLAKSSSKRELERELAKENPRERVPEKVRYLNETLLTMQLAVSEDIYKDIEPAREVLNQKRQKHLTLEETLSELAQFFLEKSDPLEKAKRVVNKERFCPGRNLEMPKQLSLVNSSVQHSRAAGGSCESEAGGSRALSQQVAEGSRMTENPSAKSKIGTHSRRDEHRRRSLIPASVRHKVQVRDAGRCTFHSNDGSRCVERQWLDFHHVVPVSRGGADTVDNLTLLCRGHHQVVHSCLHEAASGSIK